MAESIIIGKGSYGEEFMLSHLTRQRDMLKIEGFFNTLREHVAGYNISASDLVTIDLTHTSVLTTALRNMRSPMHYARLLLLHLSRL